jgi:CHAT domain-containing protein
MAERTYGLHHDQLARFLMNHAAAGVASGEFDKALHLVARAADIDEGNMRTILGAGSEAQKKAYATAAARHADRIVSLHVTQGPKDPHAARLALLAILRRKGRVLDALVDSVGALRRRLSPGDVELFDELAMLRAVVAQSLVKAVSSPEEQFVLEAAEKRIEQLEKEISRRSAEFRTSEAPITIEAVQAAIPQGAALVEIFLLHPPANQPSRSARYLAYVLHAAGNPEWVDLGEAPPIDAATRAVREAFSDPSRNDARALARALDEKVMRPIRKLLKDTRRVLLSPDGSLNLLPVGALVDENQRFLTEHYSISYLVSGRDLLRMAIRTPARASDVVLAHPDFGVACASSGAAGTPEKQRAASRLSRAVFTPLPGTAQEAAALRTILPQATLLTGSEATESALRTLHGPRLLHIATHGFFLDSAAPTASTSRGLVLDAIDTTGPPARAQNPLLFSGLALANANTHGCEQEDGLLTALEASTLDLWGTKLVVLSACETGLGKLENGEGVSGLRRALFTAGAESAIMSLWKVDDEATRDLMIVAYEHLAHGGGRAESLRQAQLALLEEPRHSHPYYWASFVPIGDYRTFDGKEPVVRFEAPPPARIAPGTPGCACTMPGASERGTSVWAILAAAAAAVGSTARRRPPRKCARMPGVNGV